MTTSSKQQKLFKALVLLNGALNQKAHAGALTPNQKKELVALVSLIHAHYSGDTHHQIKTIKKSIVTQTQEGDARWKDTTAQIIDLTKRLQKQDKALERKEEKIDRLHQNIRDLNQKQKDDLSAVKKAMRKDMEAYYRSLRDDYRKKHKKLVQAQRKSLLKSNRAIALTQHIKDDVSFISPDAVANEGFMGGLTHNKAAGGALYGAVMALCLSIWMAAQNPSDMVNELAPENVKIASLLQTENTAVASLVQDDIRLAQSDPVFDERTSRLLIGEKWARAIDFQHVKTADVNDVASRLEPQRKDFARLLQDAEGMDVGMPISHLLETPIKDIVIDAEKGDKTAQHDLAMALITGKDGIEKDPEGALFWFEKAAKQNVANAQYNVAVMYQQGIATDKDIDKALFWYQQASAQNHPQAQYNLALAYADGLGMELNHKKAFAYLQKAYDGGVDRAAFFIASLYEAGVLSDGQANYEMAHLWYDRAAHAGVDGAQIALGRLEKDNKIMPSISGDSAHALTQIETAAGE